MTRAFRVLTAENQSAITTTTSASTSPQPLTIDPDFIVILAALLCALICVLGLIAVARCAWLRRVSSSSTSSTSPPLPQPSLPHRSKANKGLKKKILRSIPKLVVSPESNGAFSDCAICLADLAAGDEIRVLPNCNHAFHVNCIDTWLGSHSSCPSCRRILVPMRCEKCGNNLPASSSSAAAASSEERLKEREDAVVRYLP